jgi:peptidyl-dipeptidase Dcp
VHVFYKSYNQNADRVWVCEYNKHLAGFLLLMHRENNSAQLRFFVIRPAFRGIGLGRKLMDLYFEFFHSRNYHSSFLWTTSEQRTAAALYARYGFQLTAEKPSCTFGKPVTEQRYEWRADR